VPPEMVSMTVRAAALAVGQAQRPHAVLSGVVTQGLHTSRLPIDGEMREAEAQKGHIGCLSFLPRPWICIASNHRPPSGGVLSYLGTLWL